jgi:hypothetical protein
MKNRERVINEIENLLDRGQPTGVSLSISRLIDRLNTESEKRWNSSPWKIAIWVLAIVLVINVRSPMLAVLPTWGAFVVFFGGFFLLAWLMNFLPRQLNTKSVGIYRDCTKCGYALDHHDSVLGEDIWVGPEICPECGERYPAIG